MDGYPGAAEEPVSAFLRIPSAGNARGSPVPSWALMERAERTIRPRTVDSKRPAAQLCVRSKGGLRSERDQNSTRTPNQILRFAPWLPIWPDDDLVILPALEETIFIALSRSRELNPKVGWLKRLSNSIS